MEFLDQIVWPEFPYPGLRPFVSLKDYDESVIFFGREKQVYELIDRLAVSHFIAVLGPSGCGKSSLVRAGLIPALASGYMYHAGSKWLSAPMEPGGSPIKALADTFSKLFCLAPHQNIHPEFPISCDAFEERFRNRTDSLVGLNTIISDFFEKYTNVLLLVDQFEELFRSDLGFPEEGVHFINLILNVFNNPPENLFIVMTMRTDFLEHCAYYKGLPEALNQTQYLTPRLDEDDLYQAIVRPAELEHYNGSVEPALVRWLISKMNQDSRYDPDLLPLMQHALMWMWQKSKKNGENAPTLTLKNFNKIGGLKEILSEHAGHVLSSLSDRQKPIAEYMFRLMTDVDAKGIDAKGRLKFVRRITTPNEVEEVAGVNSEAVITVINSFAKHGFIRWKDNQTKIDITHESLIRQWDTLNHWAKDEFLASKDYKELEEKACKWKRKETGLLGTPDLELALRWKEQKNPTKEWATRYGSNFADAVEFLDASSRKQKFNRKLKTGTIGFLIFLLSISLIASLVAWRHSRLNNAQKIAFAASKNLSTDPELSFLLSRKAISLLPMADWKNPFDVWPVPVEFENAFRSSLHEFRKRPNLTKQTGRVLGISFSPNGKFFATAGENGNASIWSMESGERVIELHDGYINRIEFGPRDILATAGTDKTVKVWEVSSGKLLRSLPKHKAHIADVIFSPNGELLATISTAFMDKTVKFWNMESGELEKELLLKRGFPKTLSFAPNSQLVAISSSSPATVQVFDMEFFKELEPEEELLKGLQGVGFNLEGTELYTISSDRLVEVWDMKNKWFKHRRIPPTDWTNIFALSKNGKKFANAIRVGKVEIWDFHTGKKINDLIGHKTDVEQIKFSPDGNFVLTKSIDGIAYLWDLASGQSEIQFLADQDGISTLSYSPNGKKLATVSENGIVKIWDVATGNKTFTIKNQYNLINKDEFSPTEVFLAAETYSIRNLPQIFWNAQTGEATRLATPSSLGKPAIWDLSLKKKLGALEEDITPVPVVAFSPDEKLIVTINQDGAMKAFDAKTLNKLPLYDNFKGIDKKFMSVAFHPLKKVLAVGYEDGTIKFWDYSSSQFLFLLTHGDVDVKDDTSKTTINALAFSLNGERLASANLDGSIKIWDLVSQKEIHSNSGHKIKINGLSFNPTTGNLAYGGSDGIVRTHYTDLSDLMEKTKNITSRTFSKKECEKYFDDIDC